MDGFRDALEVLEADLESLARVTGWLMTGDLESFQRMSAQYDMKLGVDALVARIPAMTAEVRAEVATVRAAGGAGLAAALPGLSARIQLMDVMLDQLDRFIVMATMRGAAETSGDLLKKLQGWVAVLKGWLAGVERQLRALAA